MKRKLRKFLIALYIALLLPSSSCAPAPAPPTATHVPWATPATRVYCLGTTTRAMGLWANLHFLRASARLERGTRVAVYLDIDGTRYFENNRALAAWVVARYTAVGGWDFLNHGRIAFDDERCVAAALGALGIPWPLPELAPAPQLAQAQNAAAPWPLICVDGDNALVLCPPTATPAPIATLAPTGVPTPTPTQTPFPTPTQETWCIIRIRRNENDAPIAEYVNARERAAPLSELASVRVVGEVHSWMNVRVVDGQWAEPGRFWYAIERPPWLGERSAPTEIWAWTASWLYEIVNGEVGVQCPDPAAIPQPWR